jgi:hypothetical protein
VGVIVVVDRPYADVVPGKRPPLVKGLFVEVELWGAALALRTIVPRAALHGDRVYLIDDGRLSMRTVEVAGLQPEYAIIAGGVHAGETLVVSDLFPAIDGMPLRGETDPEVRRQLLAAAGGGPGADDPAGRIVPAAGPAEAP